MSPKEILKEAFDSDLKLLDTAFDNDKKILDICTQHTIDLLMKIGRLVDILVTHELLTEDEAKHILQPSSEIKLEDIFTVEEEEDNA